MEMEMSVEMTETVDRLAVAAGMLEAAVARMSGLEMQASASSSALVGELEEKLAAAEARIEELSARGSIGRKTLQAKAGNVDGLEGRLDVALTSLSLEQRIAVKSELMRGGLLG